jgi:hypothetical protein
MLDRPRGHASDARAPPRKRFEAPLEQLGCFVISTGRGAVDPPC